MLYKVMLNLEGFRLALALTVTLLFLAITITKEKRNERKGA